jgi:ER lumen protein retaining receptor
LIVKNNTLREMMHHYENLHYFKYLADILHLVSFLILITNMVKKQNCLGISYKTQEIYLIVFLTRYVDLLIVPPSISYWNFCFKLMYISMVLYIIYLIRFQNPISQSYEFQLDVFPHRMILLPCKWLIIIIFCAHIQ